MYGMYEDTPDDAPPDDAPPADAPAAEPTSDIPDVVAWSGEVDALGKETWFAGLPDKLRETILNGLKAKHDNYDKRYRGGYETNAARAKELDALAAKVRAEEARAAAYWSGDEELGATKQKEIDDLRAQHAAESTARQKEWEDKTAEAVRLHTEALSAATAKATALEEKAAKLEAEAAKIAAAEAEASIDEFEVWLQESAPHLLTDEDGFNMLVGILANMEAGGKVDTDRALKAVLAVHPVPDPEPKPETPPKGIQAMSRAAGNPPEEPPPRDADELLKKRKREAVESEGRIISGW